MVRVCFDLDPERFQALERVSRMEGVDCSQYVADLVERYLGELIDMDLASEEEERRQHPRVKVSIPGISCVKFSDREMRSYPVVVDDISQGGVRISFKDISQELAEKLSNSSFFEVFFTLPEQSQTVSFYCRRLRQKVDRDVSVVGLFEGEHPETASIMEAMLQRQTA